MAMFDGKSYARKHAVRSTTPVRAYGAKIVLEGYCGDTDPEMAALAARQDRAIKAQFAKVTTESGHTKGENHWLPPALMAKLILGEDS